MRNNTSFIKINNIIILIFPYINYNMSEFIYYEIIDIDIIREKKILNNERKIELSK